MTPLPHTHKDQLLVIKGNAFKLSKIEALTYKLDPYDDSKALLMVTLGRMHQSVSYASLAEAVTGCEEATRAWAMWLLMSDQRGPL